MDCPRTSLLSPIGATWPAHLFLLDFITRTILGQEYSSLSSSLCSFLHSFVTLSLLGSNILLNTLFPGWCCKWTCPIQAPNIPHTKSHVPFSLLMLYQSINPGPRQEFMFCNKASFYGEELSSLRPSPSWRTTPCQLSATAYSIYSQLPSILEASTLSLPKYS